MLKKAKKNAVILVILNLVCTLINPMVYADQNSKKQTNKNKGIYSPQFKFRYITLGIGTFFLGAGVYYNYKAKQAYDESLKYYDDYMDTISDVVSIRKKYFLYQEQYDKVSHYRKHREDCYSAGLIFYSLVVLAVLSDPPGSDKNITIKAFKDGVFAYIKF